MVARRRTLDWHFTFRWHSYFSVFSQIHWNNRFVLEACCAQQQILVWIVGCFATWHAFISHSLRKLIISHLARVECCWSIFALFLPRCIRFLEPLTPPWVRMPASPITINAMYFISLYLFVHGSPNSFRRVHLVAFGQLTFVDENLMWKCVTTHTHIYRTIIMSWRWSPKIICALWNSVYALLCLETKTMTISPYKHYISRRNYEESEIVGISLHLIEFKFSFVFRPVAFIV